MLPKKKIFFQLLLISFLLLAGGLVWYFDLGFVQQKLKNIDSSIFSKLVTQELSTEQVWKLSRVPLMRSLHKPITTGNILLSKQLEQGNNVLLYSSNLDDLIGRTLLVDTNKNIHKWAVGLGGSPIDFEVNEDGKTVKKWGFRRETGVFKAWSRIVNHRDLYAILSDPERNIDYLVRVAKQSGRCFTASDLLVQNISFTAEDGVLDELGPVLSWPEQDLAKLIKPDDLVVVYNQQYSPSQKKKYGFFSELDDNGVICVDSLIIHRFGGKRQLEKELTRTIPNIKTTRMYADVIKLYQDSVLGKASK